MPRAVTSPSSTLPSPPFLLSLPVSFSQPSSPPPLPSWACHAGAAAALPPGRQVEWEAVQVAGSGSPLRAGHMTGRGPSQTNPRRPERGPAAVLPGWAGLLPCTAQPHLQSGPIRRLEVYTQQSHTRQTGQIRVSYPSPSSIPVGVKHCSGYVERLCRSNHAQTGGPPKMPAGSNDMLVPGMHIGCTPKHCGNDQQVEVSGCTCEKLTQKLWLKVCWRSVLLTDHKGLCIAGERLSDCQNQTTGTACDDHHAGHETVCGKVRVLSVASGTGYRKNPDR